MSALAAGTIAAKSELPYARVLARSFREHHPDVPFFVLLADRIDGCFDPAAEPFTLIAFDELPDAQPLAHRYPKQELTYALTPHLIAALFARGFSRVAFFKQESLVNGDLSPVLELIGEHSIVLAPHLLEPLAGADRFDRERNILQSGVYNVGFLGVADTDTGRAFLSWWTDRLATHCLRDVPNGLHFEQRWLDLVPSYFDDYAYVRDPRFNVGHWNLPERDATPLYIRFSGFDPDAPDALTHYTPRLHLRDIPATAPLFTRYTRMLKEAGWDEARQWPYAFEALVPPREDRGLAARIQRFWRKHRRRGRVAAIMALARAVVGRVRRSRGVY